MKIGDTVNWSGNYGKDIPKEAVVTAIQITRRENETEGQDVQEVHNIDSSIYRNGWQVPFVCVLDNGKWAYSHQIKEI